MPRPRQRAGKAQATSGAAICAAVFFVVVLSVPSCFPHGGYFDRFVSKDTRQRRQRVKRPAFSSTKRAAAAVAAEQRGAIVAKRAARFAAFVCICGARAVQRGIGVAILGVLRFFLIRLLDTFTRLLIQALAQIDDAIEIVPFGIVKTDAVQDGRRRAQSVMADSERTRAKAAAFGPAYAVEPADRSVP